MSEPINIIMVASFSLTGLGIVLFAGLKGWQGWLELKRLELSAPAQKQGLEEGRSPAFERIEIADLKERVRKLESIAACVDL